MVPLNLSIREQCEITGADKGAIEWTERTFSSDLAIKRIYRVNVWRVGQRGCRDLVLYTKTHQYRLIDCYRIQSQ